MKDVLEDRKRELEEQQEDTCTCVPKYVNQEDIDRGYNKTTVTIKEP
jgi:hypothetical protein